MSIPGVIDLACRGSVEEIVSRLEERLKGRSVKLYSKIDQQAEANEVGLKIRPMVLMVFGNPNIGMPILIKHPSIGIDLPLKALIWESAVGKVWLSYESLECLQKKHGLNEVPFEPMVDIYKAAAEGGTVTHKSQITFDLEYPVRAAS